MNLQLRATSRRLGRHKYLLKYERTGNGETGHSDSPLPTMQASVHGTPPVPPEHTVYRQLQAQQYINACLLTDLLQSRGSGPAPSMAQSLNHPIISSGYSDSHGFLPRHLDLMTVPSMQGTLSAPSLGAAPPFHLQGVLGTASDPTTLIPPFLWAVAPQQAELSRVGPSMQGLYPRGLLSTARVDTINDALSAITRNSASELVPEPAAWSQRETLNRNQDPPHGVRPYSVSAGDNLSSFLKGLHQADYAASCEYGTIAREGMRVPTARASEASKLQKSSKASKLATAKRPWSDDRKKRHKDRARLTLAKKLDINRLYKIAGTLSAPSLRTAPPHPTPDMMPVVALQHARVGPSPLWCYPCGLLGDVKVKRSNDRSSAFEPVLQRDHEHADAGAAWGQRAPCKNQPVPDFARPVAARSTRLWSEEDKVRHSKACKSKSRLTLAEKLEIIRLYESHDPNERKNQRQLAEMYNKSRMTIWSLLRPASIDRCRQLAMSGMR